MEQISIENDGSKYALVLTSVTSKQTGGALKVYEYAAYDAVIGISYYDDNGMVTVFSYPTHELFDNARDGRFIELQDNNATFYLELQNLNSTAVGQNDGMPMWLKGMMWLGIIGGAAYVIKNGFSKKPTSMNGRRKHKRLK